MSEEVVAAVAHAHRRDWARVLAATVQLTRDLDLAEECTQDAYAQALQTWAQTGVPDRPGAWLTSVARNRALDVLRRESVFRRRLPLLVAEKSVGTRTRGRSGRRPAAAGLDLLPPGRVARGSGRPHLAAGGRVVDG